MLITSGGCNIDFSVKVNGQLDVAFPLDKPRGSLLEVLFVHHEGLLDPLNPLVINLLLQSPPCWFPPCPASFWA